MGELCIELNAPVLQMMGDLIYESGSSVSDNYVLKLIRTDQGEFHLHISYQSILGGRYLGELTAKNLNDLHDRYRAQMAVTAEGPAVQETTAATRSTDGIAPTNPAVPMGRDGPRRAVRHHRRSVGTGAAPCSCRCTCPSTASWSTPSACRPPMRTAR